MPLKLVPPRPGRSPYWTVRGSHLGCKVNRSTKLAEKATARALLKRWQADIERGALTRPGEPTFLDAIVDYLKAGGSNRFLGAYDPDTRQWSGIAGRLGPLPMSAVDQEAINEAAIVLYPVSTPMTRNRQVFTPVSSVLKHAGVETKLRRPKGWRGNPRTNWLTTEQASALLAAADTVDLELAALLTLLLYTGLRLSEALGLTCDRVNLRESYAFIPKTKTGHPRAVFLPAPAVAALAGLARGLERGEARVFRFSKSGRLYALLARVRKATGLRWASFHVMRHTWATWMRHYGGLDTTGLVATGAWRDRTSAARYEHADVTAEARKAALLPALRRKT